jgi:MFS family permease
MNRARNRGWLPLAPALVFAALVGAVISSLGAPLIPTIAARTHVSISSAQWSLTVTLLVGAVSAPILGRLGDGPRRRGSLIGGLVIVVVGCALAAVAGSLALLVAGRALQGVGMGLLPLTMAVARDHLPAEKRGSTIGLLSVTAAAGVGVGYPISGFIADQFGLAAGFWFGAIIASLALAYVMLVVPSSHHLEAVRPDIRGAVLLTSALTALLIGIAQGVVWGWTSVAVLSLLAAALVLIVAWVFSQLRTAAPLVQLRLLLNPAVLTCDVCAAVLGVAMYANLPTITEFVQAPHSTGYGFGQTVVVAGLCLVPLSATSFAASRFLPQLLEAFGGWSLLPVGCLLVALADAFFGLLHNSLWEAFVTMALIGAGLGLTSAVIPTLIVRAVPAEETGSALGFFQVVRYIGFSIGSAMAAALLAGQTRAGSPLPQAGGYTLVLWVAGGVCVAAGGLAWGLSGRANEPAPPRVELVSAQ